MGRLTLNMLLSFAQFEREVTAERIRDKIAASKAKGMWMGGTPPLRYRPDGRSLAIVEDQATIVTDIFRRYLEVGNVRMLADDLRRDGILVPRRATQTGKPIGGAPFGRGQLYTILRCPTYVGEVHHRGQIHAGLHAAIIARPAWDAVQDRLAANRQGVRSGARAQQPSLLAGLIEDADGNKLTATHTCKGKVRYRYYTSTNEQTGRPAARIPAREIENVVRSSIPDLFGDAIALAHRAGLAVPAHALADHVERCATAARRAQDRDGVFVRDIVRTVRVHESGIDIVLDIAALAASLQVSLTADAAATLTLGNDVRLTRTGRAMRLIQAQGQTAGHNVDTALIKLIARAHSWWGELRLGQLNITELAARERVASSYVTRVVRLVFLSPQVVQAILAGNQRAGVDSTMLTLKHELDPSWEGQDRTLSALKNIVHRRAEDCHPRQF
jgi:hypothetical protein